MICTIIGVLKSQRIVPVLLARHKSQQAVQSPTVEPTVLVAGENSLREQEAEG
jgi:hypothetical protein